MPFEKISTTLVQVLGPKFFVRVSIQDLTFGCVESAEINQSAGLSYPQASDEFRCLVAAHLPGTVKAISMTVLKSEQFFKVGIIIKLHQKFCQPIELLSKKGQILRALQWSNHLQHEILILPAYPQVLGPVNRILKDPEVATHRPSTKLVNAPGGTSWLQIHHITRGLWFLGGISTS